MSTTIRITRETPFSKSDDLREDADLFIEAEALGAWLSERDIETVTMSAVLAFEETQHSNVAFDHPPIEYTWVWDPIEEVWQVACSDKGRISFLPTGQTDAVVIEIEISATY